MISSAELMEIFLLEPILEWRLRVLFAKNHKQRRTCALSTTPWHVSLTWAAHFLYHDFTLSSVIYTV